MALMRLAAEIGGTASFHAATVDHGLRIASRAEAEFVAREAAALGLPHSILPWEGKKPQSGLQAAARAARYSLLIDHAHKIGAAAIMTAHTEDDQAETVFMRRARASDGPGLAGMMEASLIATGVSPAITLLRPLLHVRRRTLRDYLVCVDSVFIEDPSNEDERFERVRARREIARLGAEFHAELCAIARREQEAAESADREDRARFEALGGRFDVYGACHVRRNLSVGDSRLIARVIAAIAGCHAPAAEAAARLIATLDNAGVATLAGVVAEGRDASFVFRREPAAVLGRVGAGAIAPQILAPGQAMLWDGRFIVLNPLPSPGVLKALSPDDAAAFGLPPEAVGAPFVSGPARTVALPGESDGFTPLAPERFFQRVNRFH